MFARSEGFCESMIPQAGCTGRGEHVHHRKLRSQGGGDSVCNCVHICHRCHEWIHRNTGDSYVNGWLVRGFSSPGECLFNYRGVFVFLLEDGGRGQ